jgi:hypothetical protein
MMLMYLYLIDGKPQATTELNRAQGELEDKLLERRDVTEVWWDDESPLWARVYLYGGTHQQVMDAEAADEDSEVSWETTDQLIFPMDVGEPQTGLTRLDQLGPVVVQFSMTISSKDGTRTITRGFPEHHWPHNAKGRADCLKSFNRDVEWSLINEWIKKEGS